MDFVESLAVRLPDVESQLTAADFRESHGLVVEVASIHEGVTANFNRYPSRELSHSLPTWTSPYPKPVLLHHDPYSEPVGRVIGSRMAKEDDGTPYIRLQIAVTDVEAIQKVMDQRYLTGSVGGKAEKATCSVCKADWSNASLFDIPCKHIRGREYDGQLAVIEMSDISWKEYSFVNMPADQRSGIRNIAKNNGRESVDFHSVRYFCLDLADTHVTEFAESASRDVLGALSREEAGALYEGLKGAFLSAVAIEKEEGMGTHQADQPEVEPTAAEEDDVLAAAESLSEDLAAVDRDPTEDAEEAQDPEELDEDEEQDEDPGDPAQEPAVEPTEEPANSGPVDEPEPGPPDSSGQPDPGDEGPDAPEQPANEEPVAEQPAGGGEPTTDQPDAPDGGEGAPTADETVIAALEARVAELEARESELVEENGRLRTALKRGLAERVVDTKIALDLATPNDREALLEEHMKRAASSLADTLRDLASLPRQRSPWSQAPEVEPSGLAVSTGESDRDVIVNEETRAKSVDPEDVLVDVLMGRRPL